MPLYDYRCNACGATAEVRHGAGETFAGACPSCGAKDLQRVFNPAPIHFKGSGFYATDSKKKSEPAKSEAAKTEPTKSDAPKSDGAKSEPKPSGESAA